MGEIERFLRTTKKFGYMDNKELTYKDIPMGYPLCFNNDCTKKENCMHYRAMLLSRDNRNIGNAVFPTAWQDGECKCFREKRFVKKAWGFKHLYDNIPKKDVPEARYCVRSYFSGGCGPYYRVNNGENKISPKQQEDIMKIIAKFGSTEGIKFDHYVEEWDFGY